MNNVKKLAVTAMLFAVGMVLPFFIGRDTGYRKDASADAYSGIALRIYCRMAVWSADRLPASDCERIGIRNAAAVP